MKIFTNSNDANAQLGVVERVSYMTGNIGIAFINTIIAAFLMFYYTDVLYLNAAVLGTIMLASRIFDGVTDLVMGLIVDRTRSRHGRARVWILRMCIPYAISGALMMLVPAGATETVQYVYVFLTYNLCNAICLTAVYVPYNAMTCNITSNVYERGLLSVFVMLGATIGTLLVQSTVDAATKALGGGARAWQIVVAIYAACGLVCQLICFFFTRERCTAASESEGERVHVDFGLEMKALFGNKYWLMAIATVFCALFSTAMLGGCGMYYAKGILGDTAFYASFANVMAISQLIVMCVSFIFVKKLGKRNMMVVGLALLTISALLQGVLPASLVTATIFSAGKGIGGGLAGAVLYALVADTIDYGEWKTGQKAEGVGMAAMTFATKIAQGITTVIIGALITWGGYDAAAAVQSPEAILAINAGFNLIPAVACAIACVLMLLYDLDKLYPKIQKELEERRKQKTGTEGASL